MNYKESYNKGITLLKEDLNSCKENELLKPIVEYFENNLLFIENEVSEARIRELDTDDYYEEKCIELDELYRRLTIMVYFVLRRFAPLSVKIKMGIRDVTDQISMLLKKASHND